MIVVVLDTNTLVSSLGWSGPPARILDAVLAGQLVLASSPALLAELERVLAYPKLARVFPDPEGLVARLRTVVYLVEPTFELAVVADEPDNRVLEAAVAVRADAIVTGTTPVSYAICARKSGQQRLRASPLPGQTTIPIASTVSDDIMLSCCDGTATGSPARRGREDWSPAESQSTWPFD